VIDEKKIQREIIWGHKKEAQLYQENAMKFLLRSVVKIFDSKLTGFSFENSDFQQKRFM
jgi:hypothetical protein